MSQKMIDIEIDLSETEEKLEFFEERANRFGRRTAGMSFM